MRLNIVRSLAVGFGLVALALPANAVVVTPTAEFTVGGTTVYQYDTTTTTPEFQGELVPTAGGTGTPLAVDFAANLNHRFDGTPQETLDTFIFRVSDLGNGGSTLTGFLGPFATNITSFLFGTFNPDFSVASTIALDTTAPFSITLLNLAAGTIYGFQVAGNAVGTLGGGYNLQFNVSAIPIPPAILLFGGALVGLGWVSRRRKRQAAPQFA